MSWMLGPLCPKVSPGDHLWHTNLMSIWRGVKEVPQRQTGTVSSKLVPVGTQEAEALLMAWEPARRAAHDSPYQAPGPMRHFP